MKDFQSIPDEYSKAAEKYAPIFASGKLYKEKIKSKLAVLMTKHLNEGMSAAKAEVLSKNSEEYRGYLTQAQSVLLSCEVGRSEMKALEMSFAYYQSMNANERARTKIL